MPDIDTELWLTVEKLAEVIREPPAHVYEALRDPHKPMRCARRGRRIRVRVRDWLDYWQAHSVADASGR